MAKLFIIGGAKGEASFDVQKEEILIGRAPENDIRVMEASVSRKHARITRIGKRSFIEDLDSQNGTWIQGYPLDPGERVELEEGIPVALGNIFLCLGKRVTEDGMVTQYAINLTEPVLRKKTRILYKDRRITNRRNLEMIYEVSMVLMQSLDVAEICKKIMDALSASLTRIDGGFIILKDPNTGTWQELVAGSRSRRPRITYSKTIVNRVIREGKAVMMSDTSRVEVDKLSESMERMQIRSIMCVPLIGPTRTHGAIYAHSIGVASGFQKEDLYFMTGLSGPAALAIENALLFEERQEAERALKEARNHSEARVRERTLELSEANKRLSQAYAQMRAWKDRLGDQLQGRETVLLINRDRRIIGASEKAQEVVGKPRIKLMGMDFRGILDAKSGKRVEKCLKEAWMGVASTVAIHFSDATARPEAFKAKLILLDSKIEPVLLILMRHAPGSNSTPP